jgi:hypothetical protein
VIANLPSIPRLERCDAAAKRMPARQCQTVGRTVDEVIMAVRRVRAM